MKRLSHGMRIVLALFLFIVVLLLCKTIDEVHKNTEILTQTSNDYVLSLKENNGSVEEAIRNYPSMLLSNFSAELPSEFEKECMERNELLSYVYSYCASDDGGCIMALSDEDPSSVFDESKEKLLQSGWTYFESGIGNKATFAKTEGIYRWLFLESWPSESSGSVLTFSLKRSGK